MRVRTGDIVVVIAGKDKGKTGQVLRVLSGRDRVVVGDINMRTRHIRKTPQRAGEIIKYEASIHASNIMLVDPKSKKPTRIGYAVDAKGKKRIAKVSGEVVVKAAKAAKAAKVVKTVEAAAAPAAPAAVPKKQPFWKKLGFGAAPLRETNERDNASHISPDDHSVPDSATRSSARSAQRGS